MQHIHDELLRQQPVLEDVRVRFFLRAAEGRGIALQNVRPRSQPGILPSVQNDLLLGAGADILQDLEDLVSARALAVVESLLVHDLRKAVQEHQRHPDYEGVLRHVTIEERAVCDASELLVVEVVRVVRTKQVDGVGNEFVLHVGPLHALVVVPFTGEPAAVLLVEATLALAMVGIEHALVAAIHVVVSASPLLHALLEVALVVNTVRVGFLAVAGALAILERALEPDSFLARTVRRLPMVLYTVAVLHPVLEGSDVFLLLPVGRFAVKSSVRLLRLKEEHPVPVELASDEVAIVLHHLGAWEVESTLAVVQVVLEVPLVVNVLVLLIPLQLLPDLTHMVSPLLILLSLKLLMPLERLTLNLLKRIHSPPVRNLPRQLLPIILRIKQLPVNLMQKHNNVFPPRLRRHMHSIAEALLVRVTVVHVYSMIFY
mmetsp:Transcript_1328/g.2303  ORF Transcript_1328/g.2303 Transcript_1328/m.2303 type:complete len:430 (-) Transcript_1328:504-1793(-)